MEVAHETLRHVVLAVDSFLVDARKGARGLFAKGAGTPSLGASILHMTYDPTCGWIRGGDGGVENVREKAKAKVVDDVRGSKANPKTITFSYKELHVEVWTLALWLGMLCILILFLIPRFMKTTYVALLLVYLYCFMAYLLSNGILLHPYQTKPFGKMF